MEWVKLGDIVDIKTGKLDANAAVENGEYPFFTTAKEISYIDKYAYDDEVVLIAGNGDLNVKYYNGKFNAYQRTYILTKKNGIGMEMKYLFYFMSKYVQVLRNQSIGGVIKYIKLSNLTEALIPFPRQEEQECIVEKFNLLEDAIAKRQEQMESLDDLVESVFYEMFGDNKWEKTKIKEVAWIDTNVVQDFSAFADEFYLGVEDIEKETGKILSKVKVKDVDIKSSKNRFTKEHILYSKIRPYLNKVALPDFNGLVSTDVFPILCGEMINKHFLLHVLRSVHFVSYASLNSTGANIPRINKKIIENYSINLPPIALQNRFADIVRSIEEEKEKLKVSLEELETLFDALMQEAFSGNLV